MTVFQTGSLTREVDESSKLLPSTGSGQALNQEGSSYRLPSSDEEGWRAERRDGLKRVVLNRGIADERSDNEFFRSL